MRSIKTMILAIIMTTACTETVLGSVDATFTVPARDISIGPVITPIRYPITYDLDGGSVTPANPASYTIESGDITLNNPTKSGYTFKGWTGSNGNEPSTSVTIQSGKTGNLSFTANWEQNVVPAFYLSIEGTYCPFRVEYTEYGTGTRKTYNTTINDWSNTDNRTYTYMNVEPGSTISLYPQDTSSNWYESTTGKYKIVLKNGDNWERSSARGTHIDYVVKTADYFNNKAASVTDGKYRFCIGPGGDGNSAAKNYLYAYASYRPDPVSSVTIN